MPNDATGFTEIPSDSSYLPRKPGDSETPPRPQIPEGLPKETADAILKNLPAHFWRYDQQLFVDSCNRVKEAWTYVDSAKRTWIPGQLDTYVIGWLRDALDAWVKEPSFFGDGKPELEKLKDE